MCVSIPLNHALTVLHDRYLETEIKNLVLIGICEKNFFAKYCLVHIVGPRVSNIQTKFQIVKLKQDLVLHCKSEQFNLKTATILKLFELFCLLMNVFKILLKIIYEISTKTVTATIPNGI